MLNILAIALSPLIAVLVSLWLQNRKEKRQHKMFILSMLMGTRHQPISQDTVRALNTIDLVFHDEKVVRSLWHEYFDMLGNKGLDNELGYTQRKNKNLELIKAIADSIGYGKAITHLDVDRVYYPKGLGMQSDKAEEIANELLRVLKGTLALGVVPREPGAEAGRPTS